MNKRFLNTLCVFFLFILTSCQNENAPCTLVTDFSADFSASYRDIEISGTLSTNRQGLTDIKINSPENLEGLEIKYENSQINISLDGLECTADEAYIPSNAFSEVVYNIFKSATKTENVLSESREVTILTPYGDCYIEADENLMIQTAKIDKIGFNMEMTSAEAFDRN